MAVGALGEILQGKACGAGCWMSAGSRLWVLKPGAVPGGLAQRGPPGSPASPWALSPRAGASWAA